MSQRASTWDEVLDDYATTIASLEHRLDSDTWLSSVDAFDAPPPPVEPPTVTQLRRFAELHRRAESCNARIEQELAAVRTDVSDLDMRREAAREYTDH